MDGKDVIKDGFVEVKPDQPQKIDIKKTLSTPAHASHRASAPGASTSASSKRLSSGSNPFLSGHPTASKQSSNPLSSKNAVKAVAHPTKSLRSPSWGSRQAGMKKTVSMGGKPTPQSPTLQVNNAKFDYTNINKALDTKEPVDPTDMKSEKGNLLGPQGQVRKLQEKRYSATVELNDSDKKWKRKTTNGSISYSDLLNLVGPPGEGGPEGGGGNPAPASPVENPESPKKLIATKSMDGLSTDTTDAVQRIRSLSFVDDRQQRNSWKSNDNLAAQFSSSQSDPKRVSTSKIPNKKRISTNPNTLDIRKNIPCKMFDQGRGECPFGNSCFYSHDDASAFLTVTKDKSKRNSQGLASASLESLASLADGASDTDGLEPGEKRIRGKSKSPCKNFKNGQGYCEFGDTCLFSHTVKFTAFHSYSADVLDEFIPMMPKSPTLGRATDLQPPNTIKKNAAKRISTSSIASTSSSNLRFERKNSTGSLGSIERAGSLFADNEKAKKKVEEKSKVNEEDNEGAVVVVGEEGAEKLDPLSSPRVRTNTANSGLRNSYSMLFDESGGESDDSDGSNPEGATITNTNAQSSQNIPCRNFSYGKGVCPYDENCHFGHFLEDGTRVKTTPAEETVYMLFPNPHGDGDICAAGVIPYIRKPNKNKVWVLLQIEDVFDDDSQTWEPALAMFGGKVAEGDKSWQFTAAREFTEETGGLLGTNPNNGQPLKIQKFTAPLNEAMNYTKYIPSCKYQVLYFPCQKDDIPQWLEAPEKFLFKFKGKVTGDWTRSSKQIVGVSLNVDKEAGGWKLKSTSSKIPSRLRISLKEALKIAIFPHNK